jgi:hypothetical protein
MPVACLIAMAWSAVRPAQAATNVVVWDTGSRLAELADAVNRAGWKAVPGELFSFEANPAKAASDPGYYGREYSFKGDVVVENANLAAIFWSAKGRVALYSKREVTSPAGPSASPPSLGRKILEFTPSPAGSTPAKIGRCDILRNADDEVALKVSFSSNASEDDSAIVSFDRSEVVAVKPGERLKSIRLLSTIDYGVAPEFIGDDLIFDPADYPSTNILSLPSENLFVGLLRGEESMVVMTWPKGHQHLTLRLSAEQETRRVIEAVDFESDGQSFYLAALTAPGIWHREELKPSHLEKDVASEWRRPFPAKWKTQLSEAGVKTTFAFRPSKGQVWRGVPGSYDYPVWFVDDRAFYHLSKKVPPGGQSLIYFVEGQDTPLPIPTSVEILKATLGRSASEGILDPAGRKLRTHHRRGGDGVHRACTCGCTEAIQAVFEKGQETASRDFVNEALGDMKFFVDCHVERIGEYQRFAESLIQFLKTKGATAPELRPYLEGLEQTVQQIPQECGVQKENMKSPEHMAELARKTMSLTSTKSTNNLAAYMELLKAWRAMGGAQDYVVAQCHTITRKLFQEAGYGGVMDAKAVAIAREIRARCRQVLRNPDGYEIWADY